MFFFKKKSPEEKRAKEIERLRKNEGEQGFALALMHPLGDIALADICIMRLEPENQRLYISCNKKRVNIPYTAFRAVEVCGENDIVQGQAAIKLEEITDLLDAGADKFIGPLGIHRNNVRWFSRLEYVDEEGQRQKVYGILCTARNYYQARDKLFAADQFEIIFADIMTRFPHPEDTPELEESTVSE